MSGFELVPAGVAKGAWACHEKNSKTDRWHSGPATPAGKFVTTLLTAQRRVFCLKNMDIDVCESRRDSKELDSEYVKCSNFFFF